MNTARYQDPYLPWIWGFFSSGLLLTGLAIPGYLYGTESLELAGISIRYPAAARKLPLSIIGAGLTLMAWWEVKNREEWLEQHERDRLHALQLAEIEHEAALEAYRYRTLMQQAEQVYGTMNAYLEQPQPMQSVPPGFQVQPSPQSFGLTPGASEPPLMHSAQVAEGVADPTAYLNNFLEYPSLLYGGQGSGKSWTARLIVARKVAAGHRVVVLDPHAPKCEWQGVEHIGAGMNYEAIEEFLQWYLGEISRRYQEMDELNLPAAKWRAQQRQQGNVLSVLCEEMTNWADRLDSGGLFVKSALTDSRKALMPVLFVSHDRTLTCLGDAKGLAKLRDSSLLELELIPMVHPVSYEAKASGKGRLKLPGHKDPVDVELPKADHKIMDFRPYRSQQRSAPSHPAFPVTPPYELPQAPRDIRHQLEFLLHQSPGFGDGEEDDSPGDGKADRPTLTPLHHKLMAYAQRKGDWLKLRDTKKNWGDNNEVPYAQVEQLVRELVALGLAVFSEDGTLWKLK